MNDKTDLNNGCTDWSTRASRLAVLLFGLTAAVLAVLLHSSRLVAPMLYGDDFSLLAESWTWPQTRANLWQPVNEHTMPLGRLSTWLLVRAAGRITALPLVTGFQGIGGILLGMLLVYFFVRRELASPFVGLLALMLFGVTAVYQQAVDWFAASFQVLALDTFLLALLTAQGWRLRGRWPYLVLCVIGVSLAPMWFASGILAGPLCTLYLLPRDRDPRPASWPRRALTLVPLLGSLLFLAISLPLTGERLLEHLREDGRLKLLEATDSSDLLESMPAIAVISTARALVDQLALGATGIGNITYEPPWLVIGPLLLLTLAAAWWGWRARRRRLLFLGLGTAVLSYLLTYAGRAHMPYESMVGWSRYQLFPQLGLVLFVCGGLRSQEPRLDEPARLSRSQVRLLAGLLLILFFSQLPRGLQRYSLYDPGEQLVLEQIERVDERCRQHHIDADTARSVLEPWIFPYQGEKSAWDFLNGSDDPQEMSEARARELLTQ